MRFSTTAVLALPALAVAEQQIPLLDRVKGFFNQATASVASVIPSAPSVPSAPVEAAAAKAAEAVQYPLTLENWKEVLTVDPTVSAPATQEWLIFVTGGNSTCYGFCGPAEKAWNVCDHENLTYTMADNTRHPPLSSLPSLHPPSLASSIAKRRTSSATHGLSARHL